MGGAAVSNGWIRRPAGANAALPGGVGTARGEPDLRRRDRGGCVVGAAGELIKVVAWADAEVDRLHAKCGA